MDNNTYGEPTRFGYEILRDHVLPSMLGAHEGDILYWAGKNIARNFPVFNIDELPVFFMEAGWGMLVLEKTTKNEAFYILHGDTKYMKAGNRNFQLEAGFIAEQYQKLNGLLTESFAQLTNKDTAIQFHVKWEVKSPI